MWRNYWNMPLRIKLAIFILVLIGVFGILVAVGSEIRPKAVLISPSNTNRLESASALKIRFSLPVSRRQLEVKVSPEVDGQWHWEGGISNGRFARTWVFEPDEYWVPDQSYLVEIGGVRGVLAVTEPVTRQLSFQITGPPVIISSSISDQQSFGLDQPLEVKLDQSSIDTADYYFELEPFMPVTVTGDATGQGFLIKPESRLQPGTIYQLIARRELIRYSRSAQSIAGRSERLEVFRQSFKTETLLALQAISPQGGNVLPNVEAISVDFTLPVSQAEAANFIGISPAVEAELSWPTNQKAVYKLKNPLQKATTYTVTLTKGLPSLSNTLLESDISATFATIGAVMPIAFFPAAQGVARTSEVRITFDQPVDQQSATERFKITPAVTGQFALKGTTLTFQPTNPLEYLTNHVITVESGIKSRFGLDSTRVFTYNFTTEEQVVLLNIAFDRQDRALSCEAAALKMALAYKKVAVSETDIMNLIGFSGSSRAGSIWDDPNEVFVGNINGSQNSTGYGVHWGPIARAASSWRTAQAFTNWSTTELVKQIIAGNPVVVWGTTGPANYDPWTTTNNKKIDAWKGEHARTVIGFKGSANRPTSIILNDPLSGRMTWSVKNFESNWSTFNNSAVVVF